jgi:hypothetical protein
MVATPLNLRRWISAAGLTLAAGVVLPALAEPPANKDGAMTFPNVSVVNAPAATVAEPKSGADQGMTAAIDASGKLRPVTSEEARALSAKPKLRLNTRSLQRNDADALQSDDGGLEVSYGDDGTMTITLTDEQMVYQVAQKTAEGVKVEEHKGKTAAERAVANPATDSKAQEVGHDR